MDEIETTVLSETNLENNQSELVAIMAPSRSETSTLPYVVGMLDSIDGGEIEFLGREIVCLSVGDRAEIGKENIEFVF